MQNQYLRFTNAAPVIRLFAFNDTTGAAVTTLTFSNTGITTTRGMTDAVHTLVTATLGTWVSSGFVHRGGGMYDFYPPITVNASGDDVIEVRASTLPANVNVSPFCVALGPDDLTAAAVTDASIAAAVAAPSAATITTAVWAATTRELSAIAAPIREAIVDSLLGRSVAGAANGGRTIGSVFKMIRNKIVRAGNVVSYFEIDDTTVLHTASTTTDATAAPITTIDPT